jgi:DNA (cytosine-5)-methyltransferase 1
MRRGRTKGVKPTCIDLFAGAGGMSAGFRSAGFQVSAALESVPVFARSHSANFPDCATVVAEAQHLPPAAFAEKAGLMQRPDVLIGGPPCQTFSTIGRAKIRHVSKTDEKSDPRNYLFKTYFEYVKFFEPDIFVLENVPQLKTKYNGVLFDNLIELAADAGYEIHISVLNAVDFGVPQNRKRLFIVGTRSGCSFSFPKAVKGMDQFDMLESLPRSTISTVQEALEDLPNIFDGCRLGELPYSSSARTAYQERVRSPRGVVGNNICRVSNDRAKRVFACMKPGDRYMDLPPEVRRILPFREDIFFDRLKRLRPEEPSWTVLAHIGMDGYMYIHPWEDRTLSVREAARIQSFDDEFTFVGNMREQYVQVGNAVPPLLAENIATSVARALS